MQCTVLIRVQNDGFTEHMLHNGQKASSISRAERKCILWHLPKRGSGTAAYSIDKRGVKWGTRLRLLIQKQFRNTVARNIVQRIAIRGINMGKGACVVGEKLTVYLRPVRVRSGLGGLFGLVGAVRARIGLRRIVVAGVRAGKHSDMELTDLAALILDMETGASSPKAAGEKSSRRQMGPDRDHRRGSCPAPCGSSDGGGQLSWRIRRAAPADFNSDQAYGQRRELYRRYGGRSQRHIRTAFRLCPV